MERKYYGPGFRYKACCFIITGICYLIASSNKLDFGYRILGTINFFVGLLAIYISFVTKRYIDDEGIKEETFPLKVKLVRWNEIELIMLMHPSVFGVSFLSRKKFLTGSSRFFQNHEEFIQSTVRICEEKYPHIQIDPEIYIELEKAEARKEMNRWRIEQVKNFFTRSKE